MRKREEGGREGKRTTKGIVCFVDTVCCCTHVRWAIQFPGQLRRCGTKGEADCLFPVSNSPCITLSQFCQCISSIWTILVFPIRLLLPNKSSPDDSNTWAFPLEQKQQQPCSVKHQLLLTIVCAVLEEGKNDDR